MTLMDLKSEEEWENIVEIFARDTNMTACLTDDTGTPIFCRKNRYPLCSTIRDNPEATTFICSQVNTVMLAVVKKTLQPELDMCDIGLMRIVVPIIHDGVLTGLVTACGLASQEEELDSFAAAKQLGITEEQVLALAQSTPSGSEETILELGVKLFHELNPRQP